MAKDKDQTQENLEEAPTPEQVAEQQETEKAEKAALKVQEDFDKHIDESDDVEETPLEDDDEQPEGDDKPADDDDDEIPSEDAGDDDAEGDDDVPEFSPELLKRATDIGLIPEEIAEFKDDADLERSVRIMENIAKDDDKGEQTPILQGNETPAKKDGDAEKPAADPSELVIENEDELDPSIVRIMKAQHKKNYELEQKLAEQGERLQAEENRLRNERSKEAMARFDKRIEDLGTDFHDTFGKGETLDMSNRSLARQNRNLLGKHMIGLAKGLAAAGLDVPSEDRLFEMAMHNVFQKKVESVQGAALHAKTSKRSRQRIGRGATKKTGRLTPRQAAVKVSEDFDELIDAADNL